MKKKRKKKKGPQIERKQLYNLQKQFRAIKDDDQWVNVSFGNRNSTTPSFFFFCQKALKNE